MSLRTQALLCFAAAALAVFGFARGPTYKYVIGAIAMMIGISLWQRDKRQRLDRSARLARIAAVEAQSKSDEDEDERAT
jgi:hypothetical protein